jgi:hypothetical protein
MIKKRKIPNQLISEFDSFDFGFECFVCFGFLAWISDLADGSDK